MSEPSAKLNDLLMDDCHVRYASRLLKELADDLALRAKAIQQSFSTRTRFLPTIGKSDELAALDVANTELARATSAQETMAKLHGVLEVGLANELDSYVRSVSPPYVRGLAALDNLVAWPAMLDGFGVKLHELLLSLGNARNMAASGYDWQNRKFSHSANEAMTAALLVAEELDANIAHVNAAADSHHIQIMNTPQAGAVLPRVPVVGFHARIERVRTLSIADVQAEFNRILEMCVLLETTGLSGFREATARVAGEHSLFSQQYLQTYLGQLRAHLDEHGLVPAQTTSRIHRLQLQHFGAINFPFDLG